MWIVIAEDSAWSREGLGRLLSDPGHEGLGAVSEEDALMRTMGGLAEGGQPPDVVVAGTRRPPTHSHDGAPAAIALRAEPPGHGVLVLSQYMEGRYSTELLAGSSKGVGYPLKDRVAEAGESVDAVARDTEGGATLGPGLVAQPLARSREQGVPAGSPRGTGSAGPDRRGAHRIRDRAAARGAVMARWRSGERHLLENGALAE